MQDLTPLSDPVVPGKKSFKSDAERVAFLFELYRKYTSLLPVDRTSTAKRKSAKKHPV